MMSLLRKKSLAEQVTAKFDLIDPSNELDLKAVGLAIFDVPDDMESSKPNQYSSMLEEIICSLCSRDLDGNPNQQRVDKLKLCVSFAAEEKPSSNRGELIEKMMRAALGEDATVAPNKASAEAWQSNNVTPKKSSKYELFSVQHAEAVIEKLEESKQTFVDSHAENIVPEDCELPYKSEGSDLILQGLNKLGRDCVDLFSKAYAGELRSASQYLKSCESLQEATNSQSDIDLCLRYARSIIDGNPLNVDLSKTQNAWLGEIAYGLEKIQDQLLEKNKALDLKLEKAMSSKQTEHDLAVSELKVVQDQTIEPPAEVLARLTGQNETAEKSENALNFADDQYEQSLDFYLEWMQNQRALIKGKNQKIRELDAELIEIEENLRQVHAEEVAKLTAEAQEKQKTIASTIDILVKDKADLDALLETIKIDAKHHFTEIQTSINNRKLFSAQFENSLASASIQLGRILDNGSNLLFLSTITGSETEA